MRTLSQLCLRDSFRFLVLFDLSFSPLIEPVDRASALSPATILLVSRSGCSLNRNALYRQDEVLSIRENCSAITSTIFSSPLSEFMPSIFVSSDHRDCDNLLIYQHFISLRIHRNFSVENRKRIVERLCSFPRATKVR